MQYSSTTEADRDVESRALRDAAWLGVAASVAVAALATLAPFRVVVPATFEANIAVRASDVLLNLGLFAPLGFALGMRARLLGRGTLSPWVMAFALGFALSAALELAQLFLPGRCSSPVDVLANAVGCALGCVSHALLRGRAERAVLGFLRGTPSLGRVALLGLAFSAIAISQLKLRLVRASFRWTLGPAPMTDDVRGIMIGLIATLGLAAWLGFALRARSRSAVTVLVYALPFVTAIEVCRGYCVAQGASLFTIALAALCALVSAHAAHRLRLSAQPSRRIWV